MYKYLKNRQLCYNSYIYCIVEIFISCFQERWYKPFPKHVQTVLVARQIYFSQFIVIHLILGSWRGQLDIFLRRYKSMASLLSKSFIFLKLRSYCSSSRYQSKVPYFDMHASLHHFSTCLVTMYSSLAICEVAWVNAKIT